MNGLRALPLVGMGRRQGVLNANQAMLPTVLHLGQRWKRIAMIIRAANGSLEDGACATRLVVQATKIARSLALLDWTRTAHLAVPLDTVPVTKHQGVPGTSPHGGSAVTSAATESDPDW